MELKTVLPEEQTIRGLAMELFSTPFFVIMFVLVVAFMISSLLLRVGKKSGETVSTLFKDNKE